jgi:hypothetical protein
MSDLRMVVVPGGFVPAVANGTAERGVLAAHRALIRVLVVPRLDSGTLGDFGLDDWPALLSGASFELHVRVGGTGLPGAESVVAASASRRGRPPSSDVWRAFFSGDAAIVRPGSRAPRRRFVSVDGTHDHAEAATSFYRDAAVDMAGSAPRVSVADRLAGWQVRGRGGASRRDPDGPAAPLIDFDRVLSMVRQHPTVMVALGLVLEIDVDPDDLRAAGSTDASTVGAVSLRAPDPPLSSLVTSPWTRYELTPTGFWPASGGGSTPAITAGAIDLSDSAVVTGAARVTNDWALTSVDVDGAIADLDAAAEQTRRRTDHDRGADATDPRLPGMRSAGLVLIRPGRAGDVASRLGAAARFDALDRDDDAAGGDVLHAEDLVSGYRLDVRTGDDPVWRSLCERTAAYTLNGAPLGEIPAPPATSSSDQPVGISEEGHVTTLATVRDGDDLRADEIVLRWNGWSLAVRDVDLLQAAEPPGPAPLPYQFGWRYSVPDGSLPRLRFGGRYQLRVRVADATGGGLPPGAPLGAAPPTTSVIHVRHDQIPPPTLALTSPASLGAGVERLVVRTDPRAGNAATSDSRVMRPPAASRDLIEQHGMFDDMTDETSWGLVQAAMRSVPTVQPDAAHGGPVGDAGRATDPVTGAPAGLRDPAANGLNAVLPVQAAVPAELGDRAAWLTEPTRRWPDYEAKQLLLSAGPLGGPTASLGWAGDTLMIRLAVGREVTLELSSTLRPGFIDHFAVGSWLLEEGVPREKTELGRNPVLSPVRRVQLVHAVRQPLASPRWQLPGTAVERAPGSTHLGLSPSFDTDGADLGLDPGSTGRLEVFASWPEPSGPAVESAFVHGETMPLAGPVSMKFLHEFGDTKHRLVTYTLVAISRFRQYFDRGEEPDEHFQLVQTQPVLNVLSTVSPPEVTATSVVPAFRWTGTDEPDRLTRTRSSWRLRLELAGEWYRTGIGERLAVLVAPVGGMASAIHSVLGRDPISVTGPIGPVLPLSWCRGTAATVTGAAVPGSGTVADLALYDVFEADGGVYCDIEMRPPPGAASSHAPFVRLSIARYQADTLPGVSGLSAATSTDWTQLLPDRDVTVEHGAGGITVLVSGSGAQTPDPVEVVVEEYAGEPAQPDSRAPVVIDPDGPTSTGVGWMATPGAPPAHGVVGTPIAVAVPVADGRAHRLRIRETEPHGDAVGVGAASEMLNQRTVLVELVDLPAAWRSRS